MRNREQIEEAIMAYQMRDDLTPDQRARAQRDWSYILTMTAEEVASARVQEMADWRYPTTGAESGEGQQ